MYRPCLGTPDAPCGEATTRTRCPTCTSKLNRSRGSSHQRGYTARWRRISEAVRRAHPWCSALGCLEPAVDTDHVIPLRAGGKSIRANAAPYCRRHHVQKTRADAERYP